MMGTWMAILGWCSLINIGLLLFCTIMLIVLHKPVAELHSRLFKVEPHSLPETWFRFLAGYKVLIIVFNIVPYVAMRIVV